MMTPTHADHSRRPSVNGAANDASWTRRQFLGSAAAAGAAMLLSPQWLRAQAEAVAPRRPNVLLILADDLGRETLGCYGGRTYSTPNLDALAARGVRFDRAYTTPVCTPSRVQMITGQYPFRTGWHKGLWDFKPPQQRMDPSLPSFAKTLKQAGYATAIAGKYQLADTEHFPDHPAQLGFDRHCLFAKAMGGHNRYWNPEIVMDGEYRKDLRDPDVFGPDIYCGFMADFMRRQSEAGKPWLAYYSAALPHSPYVPTPAEPHRTEDRFPKTDKITEPHQARRWYGGMVSYLDTLVGRLMDTLRTTGQLENTLILFIGDNGTPTTVTSLIGDEAVRGDKGFVTEAGTRVPLIIAAPGVAAPGSTRNELACSTDILPTLAETAGAELAGVVTLDGRSLLPLLRGEPARPREWVWSQWQGEVGIRSDRYRLINGVELRDMNEGGYNGRLVAAGDESAEQSAARQQLRAVYERHWGQDGVNGRREPVVPASHAVDDPARS
jgi:arylsulfatase A